jgi:hypothetical protein
MYSELTKMLGISQGSLEILVLCGIGVAILGTLLILYWKYILAGIGVLFCVVVMANHKPIEPKEEIISVAKVVENEIKPPVVIDPTTPIKPEPVVTAKPEKDDKTMFIEDCLEYTDYSKKHCEKVWNNREVITESDAKDADLLDVSNKEYKKRRAEALKKKNAVVMRATYHN